MRDRHDRRQGRRVSRALVGPILLTALLGACGIPVDSEPRAIDSQLPTVAAATPTPEPVSTQLFPVYLVDATNSLREVFREVPQPATITALVAELLEETTEEEQGQNLVSFLPAETSFGSDPFSNQDTLVAELDFAPDTSLDTLTGDQLTLALAQLVWTLTASPSIDSVIIRVDGQDQGWPTGTGDAPPGAALRRDDYARFGPDVEVPAPTVATDPPPAEVVDGSG